jgi:hypothetical protein
MVIGFKKNHIQPDILSSGCEQKSPLEKFFSLNSITITIELNHVDMMFLYHLQNEFPQGLGQTKIFQTKKRSLSVVQ